MCLCVPAHVEMVGFLQNTFHANHSLVHCGRCSVRRCANFAAPSKWMSVLRSVGYLHLEGELQEGGGSCREDEKSLFLLTLKYENRSKSPRYNQGRGI